jgi:hypothetical protein
MLEDAHSFYMISFRICICQPVLCMRQISQMHMPHFIPVSVVYAHTYTKTMTCRNAWGKCRSATQMHGKLSMKEGLGIRRTGELLMSELLRRKLVLSYLTRMHGNLFWKREKRAQQSLSDQARFVQLEVKHFNHENKKHCYSCVYVAIFALCLIKKCRDMHMYHSWPQPNICVSLCKVFFTLFNVEEMKRHCAA